MGAPGSGKGTQTEYLKKEYNIDAFAAGDIIRSEVDKLSEVGVLAKNYILKGELVPDQVVIDMFQSHILNGGFIEKGFISDGYPRTIKQAESFSALLKNGKYPIKVIYLDVSSEALKKRLMQRGRMDDTLESIERRFQIYNDLVNN
ncbi:adenylate kinase, partial [Candidatus Marinamargulisbacteria bacterium SCGC AAA071-K20]